MQQAPILAISSDAAEEECRRGVQHLNLRVITICAQALTMPIRNFVLMSDSHVVICPAGCNAAFVNNTAEGYGDNLSSGPQRLLVTPPFVPRQRSNQPLVLNVTVVDDLGQLVTSSGASVPPSCPHLQ